MSISTPEPEKVAPQSEHEAQRERALAFGLDFADSIYPHVRREHKAYRAEKQEQLSLAEIEKRHATLAEIFGLMLSLVDTFRADPELHSAFRLLAASLDPAYLQADDPATFNQDKSETPTAPKLTIPHPPNILACTAFHDNLRAYADSLAYLLEYNETAPLNAMLHAQEDTECCLKILAKVIDTYCEMRILAAIEFHKK